MASAARRPSAVAGFARLWEFLEESGIRPTAFIVPVLEGMGAAFFEGISVALLIHLARGILGRDFTFAQWVPGLRTILASVAPVVRASNGVIFVVLLALIFLSNIAKNLLQYLSTIGVAYQVRHFSNGARKLLFNRILSFGKLYFDRTNSGYLHGVVMNFTNAVAYRLMDVQVIFTSLFMLVTYVVMMTLISKKLTFIVLLVLPVLHFSLNWLVDRIRRASESFAESQSDLSRKIFNTLSCVLLVKSYVTESVEKEKFARMSDEVERLEYSIDQTQNVMNPVQDTILLAVMLVLLAILAFITETEGPGRISGLLVYFFLLKRSATSFGVINNLKTSLATVSGSIDEILKIMSEPDTGTIPEGPLEFHGLKHGIEFKGLSYAFGDDGSKTLDNVAFTIEQGAVTAIVGPTGSGKTTLINMMMRFYEPPSGTILIDGADVRDFSRKSLRARMALVSQEALLFNDTIRDNAAYGLDRVVTDREIMDALRTARLFDFVHHLPKGLDTVVGDRGYPLSGGERQRLSIARALLKGAEILILDEATSSLDSKTEKLIQEAVDETVKGKTAIVIAHRLSTIRKADWVVVLDSGRVVEQGAPRALLDRKARFFQYWEDQKIA